MTPDKIFIHVNNKRTSLAAFMAMEKSKILTIDARGCTTEPTIPSSICLNPDTIGALETQVPDKTAQIVVFCHDGGCPMSYQMATQALGEGYSNIFWYRGGINAWMAAGGPTLVRSAAQ